MANLDDLIQYYRPLVRKRAEELHAAGSRISHHTVWFPLVDAYESKEGEPHISRGTHKKAALTVFEEWCAETGVQPASMAGEFQHNLLLFLRGAAAFLGVGCVILSFVNLLDGRVPQFFLFLGIGIVLWLLALALVYAHAAFRDKVFRDTNQETSAEEVQQKLSKWY